MEKYTKKNYNDLRNYYGSFFIEQEILYNENITRYHKNKGGK